jgi:hypothetical protein
LKQRENVARYFGSTMDDLRTILDEAHARRPANTLDAVQRR